MGLDAQVEGQSGGRTDLSALVPGLEALESLAGEVHRYGGWAVQDDVLPPSLTKAVLAGLKIDNADVGRTGFVRCLPNGCVAEVALEEELSQKLRKAKSATFIIFQTPEEGIGIPVSMNGLGDGLDKMP